MTIVCGGCGLEAESTKKCPVCLKQGLPDIYFCTQECFKANWTKHRMIHRTPKSLTSGNESMETFKEHDVSTWAGDSRCKPFYDCKYVFEGGLRPWPTTSQKVVPEHIQHPDYAKTSESIAEEIARSKPIKVYSEDEIGRLRRACRMGREALDFAHSLVKPGITGVEIDDAVHAFIVDRGGYPSPLNYYKFPKSCCISPNEVICHGIPDMRPFKEGDIVNIDITVYYEGMHGDLNETYIVGQGSDEDRALIATAHDAMMKAIDYCKPDMPYNNIGRIIEDHTDANKCSIVRTYTGHGIGNLFHTTPYVYHYRANRSRGLMKIGHAFTIEPMVNAGKNGSTTWPDNWTAVTQDGSRSAQFEHTILITAHGSEILTARLPTSPPLDF